VANRFPYLQLSLTSVVEWYASLLLLLKICPKTLRCFVFKDGGSRSQGDFSFIPSKKLNLMQDIYKLA
jgi:hypothetical protein